MIVSWTASELDAALTKVGVNPGDLIFVHSSLGLLGVSDVEDTTGQVLEALERRVTQSGAIFLPAFTYSLNTVFRPFQEEPSASMGALPQRAFTNAYEVHEDPLFRTLASPGMGAEIVQRGFQDRSFGPGSLFSLLVDLNVKVLNIATGSGSTLLHELEHRLGVTYRFEKEFEIVKSKCVTCPLEHRKWVSYVRDLDDSGSEADFTLFSKMVRGREFWASARLGYSSVTLYRSLDALRFLESELFNRPSLLTRRGVEGLD